MRQFMVSDCRIRRRFSRLHAMTVTVAVLVLLTCSRRLPAQLPGLTQGDEKPVNDLQRLHSERRVVQQLEELSRAAKEKQRAQVGELLESLRAADPMLMVSGSHGTYVPLHRELTLSIQMFAPELRQNILQDDPIAAKALLQTLETENLSGLVATLHRYAGTTAAFKAHLLLATMHADRGHVQAAEYWLAPLLTENAAPDFKAAAERLQSALSATARSQSASESHPVGEHSKEPDKAPTLREGTSRDDDSETQDQEEADADSPDASSQPELSTSTNADEQTQTDSDRPEPSVSRELFPQHVHWMQSLPLSKAARRRSQDLVQGSAEHKILPWSAWEPVIDEHRIYVRSPQMIAAFDRSSGKHVWTREIIQKKEVIGEFSEDVDMFPNASTENAINAAMNSPEVRLLHRNELAGRMTSDPLRLFAVCQLEEGSGRLSSAGALPLRMMIGRGEALSAGLWEMIAIEKATGRRLWTMGGPPVEEKFGNELAMCWFAGPPAVSGDNLFGVVEKKGTLLLTCISASTGHLKWSIPLADPDVEIAQDPARQLLAARTLAKSGLVFTTTTTGWVFAVDSLAETVLWARRTPTAQTSTTQLRSMRNPAFFQTQLQPLGQVWRSETPHLASGVLLVNSADSSQLLILDPVTGKIKFRSAADHSTIALYSDADMCVVASPESAMAWKLPEMKKLWTRKRTRPSAVPVGHGVKSGSCLIVPLSDGSLEIMQLSDGTVIESIAGLRPSFSSGGLFPAGSEIVSYAPDHLALMSPKPADLQEDPDPLQQSLFLVAVGRLSEAKEALSRVAVHPLNAESVRRLRFRIAVGLMVADSTAVESHFEEIRALAQSNDEQALSHFLRLEHELKSNRDKVAESLIDILSEDESILSVEIPDEKLLYQLLRDSSSENPLTISSLISGSETLRRSLRAWVQMQLRRLVADASAEAKTELLRRLERLSDDDILGMHSADLSAEYLRRAEAHAENGTVSEATLHLLLAATTKSTGIESQVETEVSTDPAVSQKLAEILDRIQQFVAETDRYDVADKFVSSQMLAVVRNELVPAPKAADAPGSTPSIDGQSQADTPDLSYTMVPISTSGQMSFRMPNVRSVDVSSLDDPFLSAFAWSLRREPGSLVCRSLTMPSIPEWNLKTTVAENSYVQSAEEVSRFGSVIVFQNAIGLSAFSAIDHRWLWSHRMPGSQSRRLTFFMNRSFKDFDSRVNLDRGRRICGASNRWICVLSEQTLEVIDLLNGRRLWAMNGFKTDTSIVACDSVVFAAGVRPGESLKLSPIDGRSLKADDAADLFDLDNRVICSAGDLLVVWEPGTFSNRERSIDWIEPRTRKALRTLELTDMSYAQFLNPETLVAITDKETFHVVKLKTGEMRTMNFAGDQPGNDSKLNTQKAVVAADSVNYYIYEEADRAGMAMMAAFMYGLRAEAVKDELRAVSRKTGRLSWTQSGDENMFALVREEGGPVMLILKNATKAAPNAAPNPGMFGGGFQQYLIEGISRTTGHRLFKYAMATQGMTSNLRLSNNSKGELDLDAFGHRIRFLPETPAE